MALTKVYTWTPRTELGFLNDELDSIIAYINALEADLPSWGTAAVVYVSVANVAALVNRARQWARVGNVVTVSGAFDCDPTAAATITRVGIPLPVASNLAVLPDLAGSGGAYTGSAVMNAVIIGDAANDRAEYIFVSDAGAASQTHYYHFTYQVK